jgi:hypothetical protein
MPQDWSAQPEAAGPVTERRPVPAGDGFDAWPEAAGPVSEVPGQDYGSPGQIRIGPIPRLMDPEMRDRERAMAERQAIIRERAEQAALAAGLAGLQAAAAADKVITEAKAAADRAVKLS